MYLKFLCQPISNQSAQAVTTTGNPIWLGFQPTVQEFFIPEVGNITDTSTVITTQGVLTQQVFNSDGSLAKEIKVTTWVPLTLAQLNTFISGGLTTVINLTTLNAFLANYCINVTALLQQS